MIPEIAKVPQRAGITDPTYSLERLDALSVASLKTWRL